MLAAIRNLFRLSPPPPIDVRFEQESLMRVEGEAGEVICDERQLKLRVRNDGDEDVPIGGFMLVESQGLIERMRRRGTLVHPRSTLGPFRLPPARSVLLPLGVYEHARTLADKQHLICVLFDPKGRIRVRVPVTLSALD